MLLSRLLPLLWVLKWASGNCFILPREVIGGQMLPLGTGSMKGKIHTLTLWWLQTSHIN
uniref:Sialic acid binding Ig-like lectin H n=1 Tax=Mus musculus TaxID=10090 RepID=G3UYB4_MOUSE